jgi:DNA gyrase subunit A
MELERPDLTQIDPTTLAYIEALEAELARLRQLDPESGSLDVVDAPPLAPSEPPTPFNVVAISQTSLAKRTPRHLYTRQRRGGMGIFDLDAPESDPPAGLVIADENQDLLLITNQARVFRLPLNQLPESPIRSRGQSLAGLLSLPLDEQLTLALPHRSQGYLALVTQQGQVRRLRYHLFGDTMSPGAVLYDVKKLGPPAAACWTSGEDDLFIATRQGLAIRFAEQQVPAQGCLGLRLAAGDAVVAVTGVKPDGGVFLLGADGRGTIRLMAGFSPNKAPGAGGKTAMKTERLVGAAAVDQADDIFIISRLSKIIRFQATEIPAKEGVVQGVNCMALRADETVAMAGSNQIWRANR